MHRKYWCIKCFTATFIYQYYCVLQFEPKSIWFDLKSFLIPIISITIDLVCASWLLTLPLSYRADINHRLLCLITFTKMATRAVKVIYACHGTEPLMVKLLQIPLQCFTRWFDILWIWDVLKWSTAQNIDILSSLATVLYWYGDTRGYSFCWKFFTWAHLFYSSVFLIAFDGGLWIKCHPLIVGTFYSLKEVPIIHH